MTKSGEDKDKQADRAGEDFAPGQAPSADIGKDMSALTDWLSKMPMMQHPVAAFAAATAVGFGVTSQLAGLMLGAMQGMSDAAKQRGTAEPEAPAEAAPAPVEPEADDAAEATAAPVEPLSAAETDAIEPEPVAPEPPAATLPEPLTTAQAAPTAKAGKTRTAASKPAAPRRRSAKAADDLKKISGIGPKLEQVLNGLGVTRYADIAGWSEDDVKRVDAELGVSGRIERDGWVEQARALMKN